LTRVFDKLSEQTFHTASIARNSMSDERERVLPSNQAKTSHRVDERRT
jgi:hypothetical protein